MISGSTLRSSRLLRDLAVACLGLFAVAGATAVGSNAGVARLLVAPPLVVRWALVAAAVLLAFVLLGRSVERLGTAAGPRDTIRGVRLAFLALASLAAAGGWLFGSPLPIVVAFVIGGVDVLETTFLLVVLAGRRRREE